MCISDSYCSYHTILLGLAESGVMPPPRFVLSTSLACDANHLSFRRAAQRGGVPHFTVDVPCEDSPQAVAYVAQQLRQMAAFVAEHTGRALSEEALRQALERSGRTLAHYRRYLDVYKRQGPGGARQSHHRPPV